MDAYTISLIAVTIFVASAIIAGLVALFFIWSGAIDRYKKQRAEHLEQLHRIQRELQEGRR